MRITKLLAAAGLTAVMIMSGCGQEKTEEMTVQETTQTTEQGTESVQEEISAGAEETEEEADNEQEMSSGTEPVYEDNFAVGQEAAVAFCDKIKEAAAAEDLEALAELTSFPVYVGLPDTDGIVETKEDFINLGAEKIFTEEMLSAVSEADVSGQEPSMAGFVMEGESGRPNIIFGVVEGKLAITGMNY